MSITKYSDESEIKGGIFLPKLNKSTDHISRIKKKGFNNDQEQENESKSGDEIFQCAQCRKTFGNDYGLKRHAEATRHAQEKIRTNSKLSTIKTSKSFDSLSLNLSASNMGEFKNNKISNHDLSQQTPVKNEPFLGKVKQKTNVVYGMKPSNSEISFINNRENSKISTSHNFMLMEAFKVDVDC